MNQELGVVVGVILIIVVFDRTRHYFPDADQEVVDSIFKTITSKTGQVK